MSDELEGWKRDAVWGFEKEITGLRFYIIESCDRFILRIPGQSVAIRPTLAECQHLAHATARLWAGEPE